MSVRPLRQSVRPSPIFLAIVAITALGGVLAWLAADTVRPLAYVGVFIFVIAGWLVSLCLHEFGHAYTAWRFGDHDVAVRGYLTLNPLKYSNPLLSLGLPLLFIALGGIGLPGGAVYVRTGLMTTRQRTMVSLAGPFANLVLAVLLLAADPAVLRPRPRSVLVGRRVPGLPADDGVAAEPAADPRTGRLRRAGTASEPRDAARGGTGQAVGVPDPAGPAAGARRRTGGSSRWSTGSSTCPASRVGSPRSALS